MMEKMKLDNIDLPHLIDLYNRLVDNYNNGTEFEQYEEDRLVLRNVIDFLESESERK